MTKYRTIVADPPWAYARSTGLGGARAAADNYPVMSNDEIAALPVRDLADDSAHLYLWVTNPRLYREASDGVGPDGIMAAWGFRFVTVLTWHKLGAPGMGWYFRGDTEHVLFGVRGSAPIRPEVRESNHFAAHRQEHSRKPDRFYELVERVSPGPYLELFARRRRYGWDVWGNEAPEFAASQAEMGLFAASSSAHALPVRGPSRPQGVRPPAA
jgi:N6-adenosine-specific RNA methylase IME4